MGKLLPFKNGCILQAHLKQHMCVQDVQVSGELPESAFRTGSLKGRRISGISAEEGALLNKRMRSDVPVRYANIPWP